MKDISAMANASGGAILYGIEENSAAAINLRGLAISDPDAELRRLSQIVDAGIEPRISGIKFSFFRLPDGDVIVVEVPESFDSPHRYTVNGNSKFVRRMGTHTSELSYDQLRTAFDRSSKRIERIRTEWNRDHSLSGLWKPIVSGPVCVTRLSPLLSADGFQMVDPRKAEESWDRLILARWGGGSSAYNYQGLAVYPGGGSDELASYVQVHRSGAISVYRSARMFITEDKLIPSTLVGDFIIEAARKSISFLRSMDINGGAILNAGLIRLSGYKFATQSSYGWQEAHDSPIDQIETPEVWIEDLSAEDVDLIDQKLRPGLDLIWQTYGHHGCNNYDQEGRWKQF